MHRQIKLHKLKWRGGSGQAAQTKQYSGIVQSHKSVSL